MEIANGDRLKTGNGSRVYLKLAEGSTVKFGESAQMTFHTRSKKPESFFRGALDVAAGAFRFTTAAAVQLRHRELSIRVGTATIGIRGTDVWGRARADEDLVMLIEGQVEVKAPDGTLFDLHEPMTTYLAPRARAPQSLVMATPAEFAARAAETEIAPAEGALRRRGAWSLRLGDVADEGVALAIYDRARTAGFPVRIRPLAGDGGWTYEVLLSGFADKARAERAADGVRRTLGLDVLPTL
jgi:hypothetical protein